MNEQARDTTWRPDVLGEDFQARDFHLGLDPEGEGGVVATLVRHLPDPAHPPADWAQRRAVVWVPGMTDYFFHAHVARALHEQGFAAYGLDLRKTGRARQNGQHWHYSESLQDYFPDLSAVTGHLAGEHPGIVPIAHSTGGLIVPLWLDHLRRTGDPRHAAIDGVVLNSPWLDMMYPRALVRVVRPLVRFLGSRWPHLAIPGGNLGTYGISIHRDHHGEWDFDITMKPLGGHRKYLGWLRAILAGHEQVHDGGVDVGVPVLTLCSSRSRLGRPYSPDADTADTVLDVAQIRHWTPRLGEQVTVQAIRNARHDVFLSLQPARDEALEITVDWLSALDN